MGNSLTLCRNPDVLAEPSSPVSIKVTGELEVVTDSLPVYATRPKVDLSDIDEHKVAGMLRKGEKFRVDFSLFGGYWLHTAVPVEGWVFRKASAKVDFGKSPRDTVRPGDRGLNYTAAQLARVDAAIHFTRSPGNEQIVLKGNERVPEAYGKCRFNSSKQIYPFVCVSDQDKDSQVYGPDGKINTWKSSLLHFTLRCRDGKWSVQRGREEEFTEARAGDDSGRGMELSELTWFDDRLFTMDDRTGVLFELCKDNPKPKFFLDTALSGDKRGFKAEWAVQRGRELMIGSHNNVNIARSLVTYLVNMDTLDITRLDGTKAMTKLTDKIISEAMKDEIANGTFKRDKDGFIVFESAAYCQYRKKFIFLPRQVSPDSYTKEAGGKRGSNVCICTDVVIDRKRGTYSFENTSWTRVGTLDRNRGFSAIDFVPGTQNRKIVAVKTTEAKIDGRDVVESFLTMFELSDDGKRSKVIFEDLSIGSVKYEGIGFI